MSCIATKHRGLSALASVVVLGGLSGLWASQEAMAQAVTVTYTAKQIKAPSGIRRECPYDVHLSDTGDLASGCYFKIGYSLADLGNGLSIPVQNEVGRVVSWPAATSTASVLKTPSDQGTKTMVVYGIDKQGRILAGGLYGGLYWYAAGVATPWKPVNSRGSIGSVAGFSPSGQVLFETVDPNSDFKELTLAQGAQSRALPWALVSPYYYSDYGVNDAGQIALCMSNASQQSAMRFWDGQQWLDLTSPAAAVSRGDCLKPVMAENGAIYMPGFLPAGMHVWSHPAQAPEQAPEFVPEASGVSPDGGTLFGTATFASASKFGPFGKQRAAIWVNGKAVDVNTLIAPPFLQKFVTVTQMNQRGQFIVTAASVLGTSSTWLISPKK